MRIVTVYHQRREPFVPTDMSLIRWLRMSEALSRLGHQVDIATMEPEIVRNGPLVMSEGLRRVSLEDVRWEDYDVVKTFFHMGFDTLLRRGGVDHPFVISSLGSVVGESDLPGVYFFGERRRQLFEVQMRIASRGGIVTLLTRESRDLWRRCHGDSNEIVLAPGATDSSQPAPGLDPYPGMRTPRCIYSGNIYDSRSQTEAHLALLDRLNTLGGFLSARGIPLYVVGHGETAGLDPRWVTHLGAVPYERSWDYLWHADVGIVLAFGSAMNHNESTKIYYYLSCGLPVVCEAGYPNQDVIEEARLGRISPNGEMETMARTIDECAHATWDRETARRFVLSEHTWDKRAAIYRELFGRIAERKAS